MTWIKPGHGIARMLGSAMADEAVAIPPYLARTYWWAYVHPWAVRLFERPWLINLILWGNFSRLRDAALDALGERLEGLTLQIACVYGDLTARLAQRVATRGRLDLVDVLPVQLENASRKLPPGAPVSFLHADSADLRLASRSYDRVLLFFLLHEQPEAVRRRTLAEALRVLKPGGRLVVVDYHRPSPLNPLYWLMAGVLCALEPFALDLWRHELDRWLPGAALPRAATVRTLFGGLYQVRIYTASGNPYRTGGP